MTGGFVIVGNNQLLNLDGLSIEAVGLLKIANNDVLTNIDGLESLDELGFLRIEGNASLVSIAGITQPRFGRLYGPLPTSIRVLNNTALCTSIVDEYREYLERKCRFALCNLNDDAWFTGNNDDC